MATHLALLRGINVGGKNLVPMKDLAETLRDAGHTGVRTYIQSGNVVFSAAGDPDPRRLEDELERVLEARFGIPLTVVVRTRAELAATIDAAPATHGAADRRSDVLFLKHPLTVAEALAQFPEPHEQVDLVTAGPDAVYWSRLDALASRSRLSKLAGRAVYRQLTVRNWRTTTRLLELLDET